MNSQKTLQKPILATALLALLLMQGCISPLDHRHQSLATSHSPALYSSKSDGGPLATSPFISEWQKFEDRIWVGNDMWAADITSWQIKSGKLICQTTEDDFRQLTLLARKVTPNNRSVSMSIILDNTSTVSQYGAAGFLLGIPPPNLNNITGKNIDSPGLFAGITPSGKLVIQTSPTFNRMRELLESYESPQNKLSDTTSSTGVSPVPNNSQQNYLPASTKIMLTVAPVGNRYTILLQHFNTDISAELDRQTLWNVPASLIHGYPGLACISPAHSPLSTTFNKWTIRGTSTVATTDDESTTGPIVGAWHTLHKNTLRMTVQLMPVGKRLNIVKLQTFTDGEWKTTAQSEIRATDFTATFSINNWDINKEQPYRLEYGESLSTGNIRNHYWSGTIASANESDKTSITIAEPTPRQYSPRLPPGGASKPRATQRVAHTTHVSPSPTPDISIFYNITPPPHTCQNLAKLQEWYRWCFTNRELGRNTPCLGIYNQTMTYRRIRIEIAKSADPQQQIHQDDWNNWSEADMKLIYAPDMYSLTATRDAPEQPSPEDAEENKALLYADSGIGYIEVNPATRDITYNRIATKSTSTTKVGKPLPGWPISCKHNMAYDREHVGYLPAIEIMGKPNAVIQIINENNDKLVYSLRSGGTAFLPRVFNIGHYIMHIGEPETTSKHTFPNLTPRALSEAPTIRVAL